MFVFTFGVILISGTVSGRHESWEFDSGARDLSPEPHSLQKLVEAAAGGTGNMLDLANKVSHDDQYLPRRAIIVICILVAAHDLLPGIRDRLHVSRVESFMNERSVKVCLTVINSDETCRTHLSLCVSTEKVCETRGCHCNFKGFHAFRLYYKL